MSTWVQSNGKETVLPHKMAKHTQTIRPQKPTNYLSVFDHFVGLALKRLKFFFFFGFNILNLKWSKAELQPGPPQTSKIMSLATTVNGF